MRPLIILALCVSFSSGAMAQSAVPSGMEMLFRHGLQPDGKPLRGDRESGVAVEGEDAACSNCHRRSGLGTQVGQIVIPPITGKYLYRPRGKRFEDMDFHYVQGTSLNREPYTDATLALAIREGIGRNGKQLSPLMPRFKLDDATMAALIAYLKGLSNGPVPGVSSDTLHFATIIAPDADSVERQGMLDVLERFFADKNEFIRGGMRPLQSTASGVNFRVTRKWQLHVWELTGPADTWEAQLHDKLAAEPVFAVISGIGGKNWKPVHNFCEHESIPCLFPNVDMPVVAEKDFYPVYFTKGVLLEAQLISRQLQDNREHSKLRRVVQVLREGDIGEEGAHALSAQAASLNLVTESRVLKAGASRHELADAVVRGTNADTAIILWLRPDDLAALPDKVPKSAAVFISGLLGGLEHSPLHGSWRRDARITYPFDLPDLRRVRMNYPLGWFKVRHIPVVAERIQSDTYLACGILAENLAEMLDSFSRDYLVERVEVMLSHRIITGYYPRLGLAPGERFASKGGYIVRFAEPAGARLAADGDWLVP